MLSQNHQFQDTLNAPGTCPSSDWYLPCCQIPWRPPTPLLSRQLCFPFHRQIRRSEESVLKLPFSPSPQEPWESEKQQLLTSRSWPDTRNSQLGLGRCSPVEWKPSHIRQEHRHQTRPLWPQWIKTSDKAALTTMDQGQNKATPPSRLHTDKPKHCPNHRNNLPRAPPPAPASWLICLITILYQWQF